MIKFYEFIKLINSIIPEHLAENWDNPGAQVGNINKKINNILISLDLNYKVLKEALINKTDLIITHHPLFFKPIKSLVTYTKKEKLIIDLIKNDICVYSLHTNLDIYLFNILPKIFHIQKIKPLLPKTSIKTSKKIGIGAYGKLPNRITLKKFIPVVKEKLNIKQLKITGDLNQKIQNIAFCGGTGTIFIDKKYKELGIDLLITSDLKYHDAQKAEDLELAVIDAGHFHTEKVMLEPLKNLIENKIKNKAKILLSKVITNPFQEI